MGFYPPPVLTPLKDFQSNQMLDRCASLKQKPSPEGQFFLFAPSKLPWTFSTERISNKIWFKNLSHQCLHKTLHQIQHWILKEVLQCNHKHSNTLLCTGCFNFICKFSHYVHKGYKMFSGSISVNKWLIQIMQQ